MSPRQSFMSSLVFRLGSILLFLFLVLVAQGTDAHHRPVHPFTKEQANALFREHKPTIMLLLGDLDEGDKAFEAVTQLTDKHPSYIFTYSKKGDQPYLKLIELVGVDKMAAPIFLLFNAAGDKFLYHPESDTQVSSASIASFIKQVEQGKVKMFLRSGQSVEDIPAEERAENEKYMKYFTAYSLEKARQTQERRSLLVMVYASWCLYSEEFAPIFRQVAKTLHNKSGILIGKLEGPANEIRNFEPTGYPSILLWVKNKQAQPEVFSGMRKVDDIIDWIRFVTQEQASVGEAKIQYKTEEAEGETEAEVLEQL